MYYSQHNEEQVIINYFLGRPTGKLIDIGAYDTYRFSNSRRLYEIGFSGVLVEPSPANYKKIAEDYANEPRIEVLNIAVGETTGNIDFYESNGDAVSTTDKEHMQKWGAAGVQFTLITVPQISVEDFMKQYCTPDVSFISIDVESTNIQLFRAIPAWVFAQISMLIIEHDAEYEEIEAKLHPFGFIPVFRNAENIILCKL